MVRTQIQLTEEQARKLRRAAQVVGAFRDREEADDVSAEHNGYLDGAFR